MNDIPKDFYPRTDNGGCKNSLVRQRWERGYFGQRLYLLDSNEMSQLAQILMKGEKKSEAYYAALDGLNDYMEKNYGVSLKDKDSKGRRAQSWHQRV